MVSWKQTARNKRHQGRSESNPVAYAVLPAKTVPPPWFLDIDKNQREHYALEVQAAKEPEREARERKFEGYTSHGCLLGPQIALLKTSAKIDSRPGGVFHCSLWA